MQQSTLKCKQKERKDEMVIRGDSQERTGAHYKS